MGLFGHIKNWLRSPLHPNTDIVSLTIYIGLILIVVWMWNSVLLMVRRIGEGIA